MSTMGPTRSSSVSEGESEATKRVKLELSPASDDADELASATEETVHSRYTEGDCTLVSSDKTEFKINRYHLQAASARLGALESPITFAEDDGVSSDIMALFLDYVRYQPTASVSAASLPSIRSVLQFAAEWECTGVVRFILSDVLRGAIAAHQMSPNELFSIAAQYDDPALAKFAFGIRQHRWRAPAGEDNRPDILKERYQWNCMDPRTWTLDMYACVTPLYNWALQRALLGYNLDRMTDAKWEEVSVRFETLLALGRKQEHRSS